MTPEEGPLVEGKKPKVVAHMLDAERAMEMAEGCIAAQKNPDTEHLSEYVCEVCGLTEVLTEEEAYKAGWDYPPFIGAWRILSPRTCPGCPIVHTAYWYILNRTPEDTDPVPDRHLKTIIRIMEEGPSVATA